MSSLRSEVSRPRRVSGTASIPALSRGHEGQLPMKTNRNNDDKLQLAEESERKHLPSPIQAPPPESSTLGEVNGNSAAVPLLSRHPDELEYELITVDYGHHLQPEKKADDVQMQDPPPVVLPGPDNVQADDPVTEVVSQSKPSPSKDSTPVPRPFLLAQLIKSHPCVSPGIWWAHPGALSPNVILPAEIEVDLSAETLKHVQVTLSCLPTELVVSALSSVPSFLLQEGSNILSKIDPHWPKKGSLLVEVNGKGFFPKDMACSSYFGLYHLTSQ